MSTSPLADTLVTLVDSLSTPPGTGIVVERAALDIPLEGHVDRVRGRLVFNASLPHTRWKSGFLPAVHVAHLEVGPGDEDER